MIATANFCLQILQMWNGIQRPATLPARDQEDSFCLSLALLICAPSNSFSFNNARGHIFS